MITDTVTEQVVLLTESGEPAGVTDKATVHHLDTPLHLAFSCYLFNNAGQLLLTRRAASKATWPGVWTNSCCGHPAPGESLTEAVGRRLADELGAAAFEVTLALPRFRYRAVMTNGLVENEMCPVFRAYTEADPNPVPAEVDAFEWVDWSTLVDAVIAGERAVSPWCLDQITQLAAFPRDPRQWPVGDPATLPPAALP
ncbi:MAG TPA: isopentenyl-diphosphate Delta-isomerase [Pseudonocardiaceae bacterium]|jgi:isopentenyl-diphosphate delta-isomerase|nr:isopentenyl-diphosphate Delta-isomerase [Pseudonocardiaceae bacterium]